MTATVSSVHEFPDGEWRTPAPCLGEMGRRGVTVDATMAVLDLERVFLGAPALSSVVVRDPGGAPSCLTRAGFFAALTGRLGFGRSLHTRQALWQMDHPATLQLSAGTTIAAAAQAVLRRPDERRYDDIVVSFPGGDYGTLCVADVFAELAHTQAFEGLHDSLTGLANRRLFLSRLCGARAGGTPFALLFVDVDGFKAINDGLGHDVGDAALIVVAERLLAVSGADATVARLGGDEFGVLLPGIVGRETAVTAADLVVSALSAPLRTGEARAALSASVGVALGGDGGSPEELLRNADIAMYAAKRRGKGDHAFYEPRMQEEARLRLELRSELEGVLDREELFLVYQPIVSLDDGRSRGVEALLRWRRADGIVAPMEFIPVAEQTGLIIPIGRWVLREACARAADWSRARPDEPAPRIAVNISPRQLQSPTLVADVAAALADSGLPPWALTLEITESVFIGDIDTALGRLDACKTLGVTIALDDFGAGFSSLGRLSRMPIDILKLDRSFVARLDSRDGRNLASGIVALARSLGLVTVGEGIESAAQARALTAMGCQLGQGFHYGRPAAAERVASAEPVAG